MTPRDADAGLHLDQAPPLTIPAAFFLTAPLAMAAAGVLLVTQGRDVLLSHWVPATVALTHLGTLGVLSAVMIGALYQMIPVVAGTPVPNVRLAHAVHGLLLLGVTALVSGLTVVAEHRDVVLVLAVVALSLAVVLFLVPIAVALARTTTSSDTVHGMRLAVGAFALICLLGVWLTSGYASGQLPALRPLWLQVHLGTALLGWVGGLVSTVSWQVVPMFYLAAPVPPRATRTVLVLLAVGIVLPAALLAIAIVAPGGLAWAPLSWLAAGAALPAALAVWALHPALILRSLRQRRRKRADTSLLFWKSSMLLAFLLVPAAGLALVAEAPWPPLLFGWLAIWGWAALLLHGMLTRIMPFLVWFHRFSPLAGKLPIPPMNRLWPDRQVRIGLGLHLAALLAGAVAIPTGNDVLARVTGLLVLLTGVSLGGGLVQVLRRKPVQP
jgi:hypothetical protein